MISIIIKLSMELLYIRFAFNFRVSLNLRATIYCSAIRHGGATEWNFAWDRYQDTNVGSEASTLMNALACTREMHLLSG